MAGMGKGTVGKRMTSAKRRSPRQVSRSKRLRRMQAQQAPQVSLHVERYKAGRFWGVYDRAGQLVCVCVYKKGAAEVIARLSTVAVKGGKRCRPS